MANWSFMALPPNADPVLTRWLRTTLSSLKGYLDSGARDFVQFERVNLTSDLPPKPQEGCLIYVDANILPGNQKGFYYWDGSTWVKL